MLPALILCACLLLSGVQCEDACHSLIHPGEKEPDNYAIVFENVAHEEKCLAATSETTVGMQVCDFTAKNQAWQHQGLAIMNYRYQTCLEGSSQGKPFLAECKTESFAQEWECHTYDHCVNMLKVSPDENSEFVINIDHDGNLEVNPTESDSHCTDWTFVEMDIGDGDSHHHDEEDHHHDSDSHDEEEGDSDSDHHADFDSHDEEEGDPDSDHHADSDSHDEEIDRHDADHHTESDSHEEEGGHHSHGQKRGFCTVVPKVCRPPPVGLDSFLVAEIHSAQALIVDAGQTLHHDDESLVVGEKRCYNPGEIVVVCCKPGYMELEDRDDYKIMTCSKIGRWSYPKPVYCVKKYCGHPPREPNAIMLGGNFRFGDIVRYECNVGYKGKPIARLCGTNGQWAGRRPRCVPLCDFRTISESGVIKSPNYPNPYQHMVNCKWYIEVPKGKKIAFWVRDFYVEPSSILTTGCYNDFFYINEGSSSNRYCGSTGPDGWTSQGNNVTVGFFSDHSLRYKGFKIEFTSFDPEDTTSPTAPLRTGTFPDDEEDDSHVYIATEYARYYVEVLYVILAFSGLAGICAIIIYHEYEEHVNPRQETDEMPVYGEERKKSRAANAIPVIVETCEDDLDEEEETDNDELDEKDSDAKSDKVDETVEVDENQENEGKRDDIDETEKVSENREQDEKNDEVDETGKVDVTPKDDSDKNERKGKRRDEREKKTRIRF